MSAMSKLKPRYHTAADRRCASRSAAMRRGRRPVKPAHPRGGGLCAWEGECTSRNCRKTRDMACRNLQHLAILRDELGTTRRESQSIHYSMAPGHALEVMAALHRDIG